MANETNGNVHVIPPAGEYITFENEQEYIEKGVEWSLFTARTPKKELWYKTDRYQGKVSIKGYEEYANGINTIVVEFENGQLSCIHPAFLKEMQSSNFGKELLSGIGIEPTLEPGIESDIEPIVTNISDEASEKPAKPEKVEAKPKEKKKKKEAKPKLNLPEDKVHFTAAVKEFTVKMNHFTGEEDEVVLLGNLQIIGDHELLIGDAWCGYSKTLKKMELEEGDKLEFDGKVVEKKFDKEVRYKVNNPSKLKKASE